jgi:enediyne biosynthesis protein E4
MTARLLLTTSLALAASAFAQDGVKAEPLAPPSKPGGKTMFTQLGPDVTGIAMLNRMQVEHPMNYLYHSGMTTGGVITADFDGDGLPDVFFGGTTGPNKLYRNLGGFKFEDITAKSAGLDGGELWTAGTSAADVDGDGDLDLYLCNYEAPNQLFLNDGKGVFTEVAGAAGLGAVDCSHSAYFADYDGDGDLDMYLLTNRIEDPEGTPKELPVDKLANGGVEVKKAKQRYYKIWRYDYENWGSESMGTDDRLYRNDGRGGQVRFTDVTAATGIAGRGDGLGAVWLDYDRDGKMDLYVANDFIALDHLYRNNGDGTFTDTLPDAAPYTPWFSMGVDAGDVNNDLLPDIMIGDMSATSNYKAKTTMSIMGGIDLLRAYHAALPQHMVNCLLLNTGTGRFTEGAKLFGVRSTDWTWTVKFADFDLDGWQDLYFTNGISRHMNDSDIKLQQEQLVGRHMFDFFKTGEMRKEMNRSYRNTGLSRFEESSEAWGLGHIGVTYGAACADFDGDGDLDIIEVNLEEPNYIRRNDAQNANRLVIRLVGVKSNTRGVGADVVVKTKSGQQLRQLSPQSGYLAFHEDTVHFGLGKDDVVDELTIRWPGGGEQRLSGLKANMRYTITQPANGGAPVTAAPAPAALFAKTPALDSFKHKDAGWEADFKRQMMLPAGQSQLGPALAWGDVDGDGDDDAFFGGAAGEISQLRANDGRGRFTAKWVEDFRKDKPSEDMGAVFFDADGDGDLDLYVASGSNEFEPGASELADRLYLNDGKGGFAKTPAGASPADTENDGPVAAVDYDHDGKIDLFIGARCAPGGYPRAGKSRLLHNQSGKAGVKFASVPGFSELGIERSTLERRGRRRLARAVRRRPMATPAAFQKHAGQAHGRHRRRRPRGHHGMVEQHRRGRFRRRRRPRLRRGQRGAEYEVPAGHAAAAGRRVRRGFRQFREAALHRGPPRGRRAAHGSQPPHRRRRDAVRSQQIPDVQTVRPRDDHGRFRRGAAREGG